MESVEDIICSGHGQVVIWQAGRQQDVSDKTDSSKTRTLIGG
jgi:hypothetical protein